MAEEQRVLKMTAQEVEDKFRDSLQDVITVAERIAPFCRTVDEMIGILQLGLANDAQLRILMNKVKR